jgi:phosphomannomutase / phosphoglucomutase
MGKTTDKTFLNVVLLVVIIAFISIAASSGFNHWLAQKEEIKKAELEKQNVIEIYSKITNSNIRLLQKDILQTAKILSMQPQLTDFNQFAIDNLHKMAKESLPNSLDVKIFILGQYDLDQNSYPPVNFSTQKQLLQSEKGEESFPEFYNHAQGNYISLAQSIRSPETGELAIALLVSYPASLLTDNFPKYKSTGFQIDIVQAFDRSTAQTIFSTGSKSKDFNSDEQKTIHPNWKINFNTPKNGKLITDNILNITASILIGLIPILIAVFISLNFLKRKLENDINLIFEFIRSGAQKSINDDLFDTGIIKGLYQKIIGLNLKPQTPVKASKNNDNAIFDIQIADGDENLFGAEEKPSPKAVAAKTKKINPGIFRAYDIRGIVNETLTEEAVKLIGHSIGSEAIDQGQMTVIVARDGRNSGPTLMGALTQGLLASGVDVIDIGMVPTPLLYFACKVLDSKTGVMLTGSHNPSNHNGLKIVINGTTLSQDGIQKLRERIDNGNLKTGSGQRTEEDITSSYLEAVENDIILAQPMNIVIDCGNGVTGVIAEQLFTRIGCNVTSLYTDVDGNFPNHHPDPSQPVNLTALIAKVKETKAHIGIAFDGDGDRLGIVTNTGKIIWPDRLMMLFSKDLLLRSPGADIIFDVKCSNTLAETIRKQGGRPIMWKTGHSLIKAKLQESGAQLAGEMSGHIFFNDRWYGFDDGLYSAARLLEILSTDSKSSEDVFAQFPERFSTPEINIPVDDESKFDIISVLASVGDFGEGNKTDIDGIRIDYPNAWGLVRASNTTANLVTRFEADTEANLAKVKLLFKQQLLKIQSDLEIPF